ncbi:lytic polysaccharide monooxygenase [Parathielavia appendiculata]|uniref:lytic cellulose monooxygenase (C4-dehydrogenating) n=1 Tax=Parathielavia appendiculata TaxID=2587402 RepID=A0AAN6TWW5_9PEZI|nr:lytic polysaccharide monooxygenase [Parathielavia appendiculata]
MRSPFLFKLGLATAFASLSTAHTAFTTLFIDDVNQGDGTCIRMSKEGSLSTHPIAGGLDTEDMACGRDGQQAVAYTCPAPAGSKLTLEFRMWADASQPGAIDPSHKGPMAVYLKPVSDIQSDSAAGPGWFKIWDEGYDGAAQKWATEKLIANNGLLSLNLPSALPTGYYLARHEIITLQNVTNEVVDAQFYVGCAQLFIQGTTTTSVPSDKQVSIPGHVAAGNPALTFNVYKDDPSTYSLIGPEIFFPTISPAIANTKSQQTVEQTEGAVPSDCLLKNANFCFTEVPSYDSEAGCWSSAENCWKQLDACYKTAPPTGSKGCKLWEEQKCSVLQQACQSGQFQGPPDAGKKLGQDGVVNQPIPGGKIPAAVNVNAAAGGGGDGGGQEAESTPTSTSAAAAATKTYISKCMNRRRDRQLRRRLS